MPFNGLGSFVRLYSWTTDRNNGIKILASRMDNEFDGMATGLSTCITIDGQSTPTANITMANNKILLLAGATLVTDAVNLGQLRAATASYASASGGPTGAYVAGFSPPLTAVSDGMRLHVYFGAANSTTGTATFNPDALGAANIVKSGGSLVGQNEIKVGVGSLTRYGSVWYYAPPLSTTVLGVSDGGIFTSGTVQVNTAYMVDASASAQSIAFPLSPATGDTIPLTIFGTQTVTLWASGNPMYGATSSIDNKGTEGFFIPRWTGPNRGWIW